MKDNTMRINVTLPETVVDVLDKECKKIGISRNAFITIILYDAMRSRADENVRLLDNSNT